MIKNTINPSAFLLIGLLWGSLSHAQQSVNTSGGDATGSGGNIAYSVGQLVFTTNTGSSGNEAQGVQHAFEIYTVGIMVTDLSISLKAFPNPTSDGLTLQVDNFQFSSMYFQLYDMQGKLISHAKIVSNETIINTSSLPSANYILDVVNKDNKKIQSFKIIKN
jgi:hypothetical protein